MSTVEIIPFSAAYDREKSHADLLEILLTAHFWRLKVVELTFLSLVVFWLVFAIAARL